MKQLLSFTYLIGLAHLRLCVFAQSPTPDDPQFPLQWNLARIGATNVWPVTTGSTNVVVAVIDTGVDYTHPDLAPNMWRNPGETGIDANNHDRATNGMDDDGNGYVDDVHGIDVYDHDGDPREIGYFDGTTTHYHGSDCAGIIGAAGNNGIGIAGINWKVSIMAIRGFPLDGDYLTEEAYVGSMIAAFEYVLEMKRRGVNIVVTSSSYFNASHSQALKDLIDAVGAEDVLNVFAAGNNGMNNDDIGLYPCGYNSPSIISVGNSMRDDVLAPASCYGKSTVHLTAPGRDGIRGVFNPDFRGTSASCPHVAGAVALLRAAMPEATAAEIKAALLGGVDQPAALGSRVVSRGRLNIAKALARLADTNAPPVVVSAHPAGPRTRSNDAITVTFSRPMNAATVEAAFQLSPPYVGHFEWTNQNRTFTFVLDAPLARTNHTARILGSAADAEGTTLDGNFNSISQNSPADDFVWTFSFPAPNDDFATAAAISGATGAAIGTTRNASPETIEPNHVGHPFSSPSLWYQWPAPESGWFTMETLRVTTSFDTLLAIYTGTDLSQLTPVAANDNYGSNIRSRVSFAAIAGQTYKIVVAGKSIDENKADLAPSSFGALELAWYPTPAPNFTGLQFSPASGAPGTAVTLFGSNFTGATSVLFNGAAASFTYAPMDNLDLRMTGVVPPDAESGPVTIMTPHGEVTSAASFRVLPPPLTVNRVSSGGLVVSWPATSSAFALETTDHLPSATWAPVTEPLTRTGGITTVSIPAEIGSRYYRLKAP